MISSSEAKKKISETISRSNPVQFSLEKAAGLVLAENIYAPVDIPAFSQSSMDGYALCFDDLKKYTRLNITGEAAAGSSEQTTLSSGHACRIFTGAALPTGADTIVIQEKIKTENGELVIEDENLKFGANVRPKGSEISAGAMALPKEHLLTPAATGFLAAIGINIVKVYPMPSVSVIITGNELQEPGKPLIHGQVYDANSYSLRAALEKINIRDIIVLRATDSLEDLTDKIMSALEHCHIVLLTGGVSVGDYDFVLKAAAQCGIENVFHKIKQRPGKPLFFGKKNQQLIFGLPGNPSSVLTCYYEYVMIAIEKMTGLKIMPPPKFAPLASDYKKQAGMTHYLKGIFDGEKVILPEGQESYKLNSFARANCLVLIPEEKEFIRNMEEVEIHLLP